MAVLSVIGTLAYVAALSGNYVDIKRNYSLHHVNVSALRWNPFAPRWRRRLNQRHTEAIAQCKQLVAEITTTGV